jgi:hypothetical protein
MSEVGHLPRPSYWDPANPTAPIFLRDFLKKIGWMIDVTYTCFAGEVLLSHLHPLTPLERVAGDFAHQTARRRHHKPMILSSRVLAHSYKPCKDDFVWILMLGD